MYLLAKTEPFKTFMEIHTGDKNICRVYCQTFDINNTPSIMFVYGHGCYSRGLNLTQWLIISLILTGV